MPTHVDINHLGNPDFGTIGERGTAITHDSGGSGRTRAGAKVLDGVRGLFSFLGNTLRENTATGGLSVGANSPSSLANRPRLPARGSDTGAGVLGSASAGAAIPEVTLHRACAGEPAHPRVRNPIAGGSEKPTAVSKIGEALVGLPLSKVKIVIGEPLVEVPVRQVSSLSNVDVSTHYFGKHVRWCTNSRLSIVPHLSTICFGVPHAQGMPVKLLC